MKYIKNTTTYILIISTSLSASSCLAFDLGAYKPDWSTWQKVKNSYIAPAWQKISNISPDYAKALGNTALTGLTTSPGKIGTLFSAYSGAEPIYNRYMQRAILTPQERSKLDYLADIGGHTLAVALPALIRLYQQGKIDAKILYRLITDPMVLATAGTSAAAGLAATGLEWFNEPEPPLNIETASVDQLNELLKELETKRESLQTLWNTEEQRLAGEWENIQESIKAQVGPIDDKIQAINAKLNPLQTQ